MSVTEIRPNMQHWQERVDLAAAFRWTARLNMQEGRGPITSASRSMTRARGS